MLLIPQAPDTYGLECAVEQLHVISGHPRSSEEVRKTLTKEKKRVVKIRDLIMRFLSIDEWMKVMERGEGDWMLFDIAEWDGDFIIVERDGKMLAYLQHQPHECQQGWHIINRLETRPYYRRRGYARRLVQQVMDVYHPTKIIARGVQPSSIPFWQQISFVPNGYDPAVEWRKHYKEGDFVWEKEQRPLQTRNQ